MSECIFTIYYENGKECGHNFKCDGCEVSKAVKRQVEIIMEERGSEESANAPDAYRCHCADDQGGPCSACMEAKYNL